MARCVEVGPVLSVATYMATWLHRSAAWKAAILTIVLAILENRVLTKLRREKKTVICQKQSGKEESRSACRWTAGSPSAICRNAVRLPSYRDAFAVCKGHEVVEAKDWWIRPLWSLTVE